MGAMLYAVFQVLNVSRLDVGCVLTRMTISADENLRFYTCVTSNNDPPRRSVSKEIADGRYLAATPPRCACCAKVNDSTELVNFIAISPAHGLCKGVAAKSWPTAAAKVDKFGDKHRGNRDRNTTSAQSTFFHKRREKRPHKEKSSGVQAKPKPKKRRKAEELDSDRTDQDDAAIDDLDPRAGDQPESSGDEDIGEAPAQRRLRLANFYLLAERDRSLGGSACPHAMLPTIHDLRIAEGKFRWTKNSYQPVFANVLRHSGTVHLFIADTVSRNHIPILLEVPTADLAQLFLL